MTKASFEGWGGIIVKLPGGTGGITGEDVGI